MYICYHWCYITVLYRLTATDVDGASNFTTANITVLSAIDNPPIANAGSAKKLVWPHDHVILYGNASFDDNVCIVLYIINCLFIYHINMLGYCFIQMGENSWPYSGYAGELLLR